MTRAKTNIGRFKIPPVEATPLMIDQIRRELAAASRLDPYNGFEQAYVCLVKLALEEPEPEEFARLKRTVSKLPQAVTSRLLDLPQVDDLLNLTPPLETILSHQKEELHAIETAEAMTTIRTMRHTNPRKALRSLVFVLKIIRNKREHGFKSADGPRDQEILSAARAVVTAIAEECIATRVPLRKAK